MTSGKMIPFLERFELGKVKNQPVNIVHVVYQNTRTLFKAIAVILFITFFMESCSAQKGVKPFGTDNKKAFIWFGDALRQHDLMNDDAALDILNKALKKDPNYVDALSLKGEILMNRKSYEPAIQCYQKILTIKPDHVYALTDLSRIYFELDRYDDCLRTLNQMLPVVGVSDKRAQVQAKIAQAEFAKYAFNHPVPFEPINMGPNVNSDLEDYFPGLSTDENQLYFTRRDGKVNIFKQNEDIFMSEFKDGAWTKSMDLGEPVNTVENEGAFSASPDGKFLLFTACSRPGGIGRCDIWITRNENGKWTKPENIGKPINTVEWESQPSLAADGVTLYFTSNRPGGYGGADIWVSTKTENGWSQPKNLGPKINTPGEEQFPFIHNDGKTLYFTSEGLPGMGKSDIFFSRLVNGQWTDPVNLGYPINTHGDEWNFIVNRTGDKAYFASDGIAGGYGGMDIYSMDLYEAARPNKTGYLKGIVFDIDTKERLSASIDLYELQSKGLAGQTFSDKSNGTFLLTLPSNANYALEAKATGYLFHSENFALKESSLDKPFVLEIGLKRIKSGQTIVMNNVFFDVDQWDLKEESKVELDIAVDFLKNNPTVSVEIGGHTDNTGTEAANKILSEKRAKSVHAYFVNAGINADRLTFKGYGSSEPVADNETIEGKARNRRTELKVMPSS